MGAIEQLFQPPVAQAIGWALLQFVWQGALVGIISALALLALRRSAADVRYVVATIGLALMLTMPAVTAVQTWRSIAMTDVGESAAVESWTASPIQSEPKFDGNIALPAAPACLPPVRPAGTGEPYCGRVPAPG